MIFKSVTINSALKTPSHGLSLRYPLRSLFSIGHLCYYHGFIDEG